MQAYQTYGIDATGHLTHAGPNRVRRMNLRAAWRIQQSWERWRKRYLATHPGEYPLRTNTAPTVALRVHPVGQPQQCAEYRWCAGALADAQALG